jgi:hypothetical protein
MILAIFCVSAAMAVLAPMLMASHPRAAGIILGVAIVTLLYAIFEFVQQKHEEKR